MRADPDANTNWPELFAERAAQARDPRLRDYYARGMVSADTPLKDVPLIAVDFETTGLDARKHGIVSVGAVPFNLQRVRMREAKYWVVKPRRALTDESVVIHGITHSDIANAPDFDAVLEQMLQAFAGHVWVVHYRGIERDFFKQTLLERIREHIDFPVIDTMQLESRLHRVDRRPWWQRWRSINTQVSIRLADSRARYHLPHYAPHDAMTDAQACAELLQAQVAHFFEPEDPVSEIWVP
ncbi:MAG: 3'-5' exonuclease [Idiomarina sp.]|nr:3'-5' exonuclease [Idiomarina sp.]